MANQTLTRLLAKVINLPESFKHCGFSTYEINKDNEKYYDICKNFDKDRNYIFTGESNSGKSHLGVSIIKNYPEVWRNEQDQKQWKLILENELQHNYENHDYIQELLDSGLYKYRPAVCFFMPFVDFMINSHEPVYTLNKLVGYDSLLIDDFYLQMKDSILDQVYYIIDTRHRNKKQTIITTRFTYEEIYNKQKNLATRLYDISEILYLKDKYGKT